MHSCFTKKSLSEKRRLLFLPILFFTSRLLEQNQINKKKLQRRRRRTVLDIPTSAVTATSAGDVNKGIKIASNSKEISPVIEEWWLLVVALQKLLLLLLLYNQISFTFPFRSYLSQINIRTEKKYYRKFLFSSS